MHRHSPHPTPSITSRAITACAGSWPRLLAVMFATQVATLSVAGPLPRSTPESQGISSESLLALFESAETEIDALHSLMIVRNGRVIAEGWWAPYASDEPHMLFSLSKSFTATGIGLAAAEGRLSIDDLVLPYFPSDAPAEPSENLKAMRIRDLLMMSTGHHAEAISQFPYDSNGSLVRAFLALPVAHKPGTAFLYNTPASYMLSAIVQKATGEKLVDYLRPRLFEPLGIAQPRWEESRQGICMGGFGLSATTEDIARFGQLYLQEGKWNGRQILPAEWVRAATSRQTSNGSSPSSDWEQGYGFQFWRCRHGFYRGDGAHGQYCVVMPEQRVVVAITAGTRNLPSVLNLLWEKCAPLFQSKALPENAAARLALAQRLARLTLATPQGAAAPPKAMAKLAGKRFVFPANARLAAGGVTQQSHSQPIEAFAFEASDDKKGTHLALTVGGQVHHTVVQPDKWVRAFPVGPTSPTPAAASGAWSSENTFVLKVAYFQTPFTTTYTLVFSGNQASVTFVEHVGAGGRTPSQFIATVQ
ncbi:MAG: beta-lactamase family protein [Opitutaceae bacterium]|nr:beta-lactamase family protein [Opitutaceae bacterium]